MDNSSSSGTRVVCKNTLRPKSLLSKKNRNAPPAAQVQTLVRIARRATVKADWLDDGMHGRGWNAVDDCTDEIRTLRAKAAAATDEILAVVRANPDYEFWTLPQRRAAGI